LKKIKHAHIVGIKAHPKDLLFRILMINSPFPSTSPLVGIKILFMPLHSS
jgi:hypothetical protein